MGCRDDSLTPIRNLQLVVLLITNMTPRVNSICRIEIYLNRFYGALSESQLRERLGECGVMCLYYFINIYKPKYSLTLINTHAQQLLLLLC